MPYEDFILVNAKGEPVKVDLLVEDLRKENNRVLSDDEIGLVIYVGDLDLYQLTPTSSGDFLAKPVTQISRPRFSKNTLRKQIGSVVLSVTEDAVFVVKKENHLEKVRAEKLEVGMKLATGEKVYR